MRKTINVVVLFIKAACFANAQQFDFPEPRSADPATLAKPMSALAKQLIDTYKARVQLFSDSYVGLPVGT
jgi:hypothetical protein